MTIRTQKYKYSVRELNPFGFAHGSARVYFEDYLYDLEKDPIEKNNLVKSKEYADVREDLKYILIDEMVNAGEERPVILPALFTRKK